MVKDTRIGANGTGYRYFENLKDYLGENALQKVFSDEFYYPRQLEIHLPSNHKISCNLNCQWCQGKNFEKGLGLWETEGLNLLDNLKGGIPFHIYGGNYTEPTMNPYLLTYLSKTKYYGNHFGIHTNGTLLKVLEDTIGFITELDRLATDDQDYISISLDGGLPWYWSNIKRAKATMFNDIITGIRMLAERRKKSGKKYAIRICFLLNGSNGTEGSLMSIIGTMKDIGVDSIRFSIPYASFKQNFEFLEHYKHDVEEPLEKSYEEKLSPYLSKNILDKPYIFYVGAEATGVHNYSFSKCIYHAYQITLGSDGYFYKCSSVAAPDSLNHRLGKVSGSLQNFQDAVDKNKNSNKTWNCKENCFDNGLRCNRMAIELNQEYDRTNK